LTEALSAGSGIETYVRSFSRLLANVGMT